MMPSEFADRVVLVTGGGRNLGFAIASAFARGGARVAISVRENKTEGEAAVRQLAESGARQTLLLDGDVADPAVCKAMAAKVAAELGPVDILVNTVGMRPHKPFADISAEEWRQVFDTNCSSAFYLSQAVLPAMVERGFGRIIALGGSGPGRAGKLHSHISVSKAALAMLMSEIALSYGPDGITANTVVPGPMNTKRHNPPSPWPPTKEALAQRMAIPRLGEPSEIAATCTFLASEGAAYITGQQIKVNGGSEMW
jgi:3-oxoacyl-[acyl-carrier protein] reductase